MIWRWLYAGATWLALPLVFVYFAWRGRAEPAYRRHWADRLGYIEPAVPGTLWVHAASVGEVILVAPLIEALIARYPERRVLLTTITPTGRAEAERRLGDAVALSYLPLDTPGATRRFMRRLAPAIGILAETELWPNLVAAATRRKVPLVLVNATLSARSAAVYRRWPVSLATRFMLARFRRIAAAEAVHAERFIAAGAPRSLIQVTGNLKYDRVENVDSTPAAASLRQQWQAVDRPIWLAASTHAPEEAELIEMFAALRRRFPDLLWVIAPRHPQRFDEVAELIQRTGWQSARRSHGEPVDAATDIVLADTLGELDRWYALSDVAFVGGSLTPDIGGHNVIEPAAAACVFVTGPHAAEWREAMAPMTECGGAVVADDAVQVAEATAGWLSDPKARRAAGRRLAAVAESHRGALARTQTLLDDLIGGP